MRLVLAFVFVLTASLSGQIEHAPTVEQCQADQRLWFSEIEAGNSPRLLPPIDIIMQWNHEMTNCQKVDPDNKWRYYNTAAEIDAEEIVRLAHFLDRHDLRGQFEAEDAAGKR